MKKFLLLLFLCFLTSCVVYDETQPFRPPYQEHVVIYDVFPQTSPFYNFIPSTYTYYGPRNYPYKPRKPRKFKKDVIKKYK